MASAAPCTGLAPAPRAALLAPTDDRRPLSRTAGAWLCLVIAALPELPRCVISPTTIEPSKASATELRGVLQNHASN